MLKKLLLSTAMVGLLASPAMADAIVATARVDGTLVATGSSLSATLDVNNQAFGPDFNLNTLTINSQGSIAAPGVLSTNTFDVNQTIGGTHTLMLDILATGLMGPNALTNLLSTFSVSGLPAGWSVTEETLINGSLLATTPLFSGVSDSASAIDAAFLGNPFSAEVIYTVNSVGTGNFNGGIDISVAAVPEPATWAMVILGFAGVAFMGMRRRREGTAFRLA